MYKREDGKVSLKCPKEQETVSIQNSMRYMISYILYSTISACKLTHEPLDFAQYPPWRSLLISSMPKNQTCKCLLSQYRLKQSSDLSNSLLPGHEGDITSKSKYAKVVWAEGSHMAPNERPKDFGKCYIKNRFHGLTMCHAYSTHHYSSIRPSHGWSSSFF